ncbi:MAG: hypothetical protein M1817_003395 [Caeruleum heppii]|nr:MAG: hypothetical protein M1817_003395 [Caeruleum heppii]
MALPRDPQHRVRYIERGVLAATREHLPADIVQEYIVQASGQTIVTKTVTACNAHIDALSTRVSEMEAELEQLRAQNTRLIGFLQRARSSKERLKLRLRRYRAAHVSVLTQLPSKVLRVASTIGEAVSLYLAHLQKGHRTLRGDPFGPQWSTGDDPTSKCSEEETSEDEQSSNDGSGERGIDSSSSEGPNEEGWLPVMMEE